VKLGSMRTLLFTLFALLALFSLAMQPVAATEKQPLAKSRVINILFDNLEDTFPASQACGASGTKAVKVKKYIQTTLGYLAEESSKTVQVEASCESAILDNELIDYYKSIQGSAAKKITNSLRKLKSGITLYQCEVSFNNVAGENTWSRGIQFLISKNSEKAVKHSFRCLMTP